MTRDDGTTECAWAAFERDRMHQEVNAIRTTRGLSPVPLESIEHAEQLAVGHTDYALKFAFRCAELATTKE